MNPSFEKLAAAVAEFHKWVELPRHQHLFPKLMYEFTPASVWADQYKVDARLPGCYVFEDDEGDLYYVGSVSANSSFGYRFANGYVCKDPKDTTKIMRLGHASSARRIYVVDVPKEYAFIAPALEQFLISYLNPRCNSKDGVPALRAKLIAEGCLQSAPPASDAPQEPPQLES